MDSLGKTIRKLRLENDLPLRTVAAYLDIDQAILSKIERGQRNASREQVIKLAGFFKVNKNELLVFWLSDKLMFEVADEELAIEALQLAEEKVSYGVNSKTDRSETIHLIKKVLKDDGRVSAAWLFGSIARGEEQHGSDVDIVIEMNSKKNYSMFDLLDIAHIIEQKIKRRVDLVEKGYLKDFARHSVTNDLIKIYG